jgi:hypothetical protein
MRLAAPRHPEAYYATNFHAGMRAYFDRATAANGQVSALDGSGIGKGNEPDYPSMRQYGYVPGLAIGGSSYIEVDAGGVCGPASAWWGAVIPALEAAGLDPSEVITRHDNHSKGPGYTPATSNSELAFNNLLRELTIANKGGGEMTDGVLQLPDGYYLHTKIINLSTDPNNPLYTIQVTVKPT